MRLHLLAVVPSLSSATYREEEVHSIAPFSPQERWSWKDAEKRAYEEGSISVWGQMMLKELEAEARLEREKRIEEIKSRTQQS